MQRGTRPQRRFTMNDHEIRLWVENDRSLYSLWSNVRGHMAMREFINENRSELEKYILQKLELSHLRSLL